MAKKPPSAVLTNPKSENVLHPALNGFGTSWADQALVQVRALPISAAKRYLQNVQGL
jgi:hypothetical protein